MSLRGSIFSVFQWEEVYQQAQYRPVSSTAALWYWRERKRKRKRMDGWCFEGLFITLCFLLLFLSFFVFKKIECVTLETRKWGKKESFQWVKGDNPADISTHKRIKFYWYKWQNDLTDDLHYWWWWLKNIHVWFSLDWFGSVFISDTLSFLLSSLFFSHISFHFREYMEEFW